MGALNRVRQNFWRPPRSHDDVIEDRQVSFLELFSDLAYVVVVGRAAHTLADHLSWRGVAEFAAVFGLVWIAWFNGTTYHDLHGREDGRTRSFVFLQMSLLSLLAVFTADAAGETGAPFAIVYGVLLLVLTWLWHTVRRRGGDEYRALAGRYMVVLLAMTVAMAASSVLPDGSRFVLWAALVLGWAASLMLLSRPSPIRARATDSLVERYGLFVIVVLGEVIIGVVDGLSDVDRSVRFIATGMVGLLIGFGYWWTYFDFLGRRSPADAGHGPAWWMLSHLPITMSIAAAGAAMVSLVERADEPRTPVATAWLLTGAFAVGLLALLSGMRAGRQGETAPVADRRVVVGMIVAAACGLGAGWWRPTPWLLAAILVLILTALWIVGVSRGLGTKPSDFERPSPGLQQP